MRGLREIDHHSEHAALYRRNRTGLVGFGGRVAAICAAASRNFLKMHGEAFGVDAARSDFIPLRVHNARDQNFVHLQQTFDGLPIISAEVVVQFDAQDRVAAVMADPDTTLPKQNAVSVAADTLRKAEGERRAIKAMEPDSVAALRVVASRRVIYVPGVLGIKGKPCSAWEVTVESLRPEFPFRGRALVNAQTGELANFLSENFAALSRNIYDANGTTTQ